MILKKVLYGQLLFFMVIIAAFLYYVIMDDLTALLICCVAAIIDVPFQLNCSMELSQLINLIKNGELGEFEKNRMKLTSHPIGWARKLVYESVMGVYLYLSGKKEEAIQGMEDILLKTDKKQSMIGVHYRKNILANLCMFLLIEGEMDKLAHFDQQLDGLIAKDLSKLAVIGNERNCEYIHQVIQEAMQFERDHDKTQLMKIQMLLENELVFYTRIYLMMYLAKSYEGFDRDVALSYYRDIAEYGKELEISALAKAKCEELIR